MINTVNLVELLVVGISYKFGTNDMT